MDEQEQAQGEKMSSKNVMIDMKTATAGVAAAAGRFAGYCYGPDLSHYNKDVSVQMLVDHGCAFIIQKISDGVQMQAGSIYDHNTYKDPTADGRIQQAYEAKRPDGGMGVPVGLYHYMRFWPQKADRERQIEYLLKNLTKSKVPGVSYHFVILDIEGVKTNTDGSTSPVDTNTNIRDQVENMANAIWDALPGMPLLFYVNNFWLEQYSPALRDWLSYKGGEKLLHMAQWPWPRGLTVTWENFAQYIPTDTVKVLTPGYASWKFWQYLGDAKGLEGISNSYDMNLYHGTRAELYAWLGFRGGQAPADPDPEPEPDPEDPEPENPQDPNPPATGDLAAVLAKLDQLDLELMQVKGEVTKIGGHFK